MTLKQLLEKLNNEEKLQYPSDMYDVMSKYSSEARTISSKINNYIFKSDEELNKLFTELIGKETGENFVLFTPFSSDFGKNIHVGNNVFINSGCKFQDQGGIYLADNVLVGHNVVFATLNHGIKANDRGTLYPKAIRVEKNVWIGSKSTILQGVTIGENAIIAAGSVVAKDVAPNTIVGGTPAKFIRIIEE